MTRRPLAAIVLCAVPFAACGGSSGEPEQARKQATPKSVVPPPASGRNPLELPAGIPLKASRAADPDQTRVIRAWSSALRRGDIDGASAMWAVPSKVQNGTPVLKLGRRKDVQIFNAALPCGSVVTSAGGAPGGFTIAKVRLTRRKGGDCGSGTGNSARTAIRVRDGQITEWYRLPDDPDAPGLLPPPQAPRDDGVESTIV